MVVRVNEGDDTLQFQNRKCVVAYRGGRFGRQAAIPVIGMQAVPDLDFVHLIHHLAKKSAIADQPVLVARDEREWTRQTFACWRDHAIEQKPCRLFAAKNAARKAHEIRIRHQDRHRVEVRFDEMTQDQARRFDNRIHGMQRERISL